MLTTTPSSEPDTAFDEPKARRGVQTGPTLLVSAFNIALWVVAFVFYIAPEVALARGTAKLALFLLGCSGVGATLCWALYLIVRGTAGLARSRQIGIVCGATLLAVFIHGGLDTLSYSAIFPGGRFPQQAYVSRDTYLLLNNTMLLMSVYVIYVGGVALIQATFAIQERERSLAAARAAAQEAQLAALRFQINPHFLFNALNAVTSLIGSDRNAEASTVVARLAEFFRASLNAAPGDLIQLEEEFDVVGSYLDIEAARFGARLVVDMDCPPSLQDALIPHFLLQPLVENAVKHGVARSKRPVTITVGADARDGALILTVRDNASPAPRLADEETRPHGSSGVGLRNVANRLRTLFGTEASIEAKASARGFTVEIRMPLRFYDQRARAA